MGVLRIIFLLCLTIGMASAAEQKQPLVFGVFPYISRVQLMDVHTPLRVYLEQKLGQPVDLVTAPDYAEFLARTQRGEYDLILTAPHFGRLAELRDGYLRLAMTGHQVKGVFLVSKDSDIKNIADLKGKTVMIAQPLSIIYQLSEEKLRAEGLSPGKDVTIIETRTFNNAISAPARKEADAAVTGQGLWAQAPAEVKTQLREIGSTRPVPGFMLMANKRLPAKLVKQAQHHLLGFERTSEGRAYFDSTFLLHFEPIDGKTMRSLDPFAKKLRDMKPAEAASQR